MNYEANCKKNILCDFDESMDLKDALIEICRNCGRKIIFNKKNGTIDDAKYLRFHLRDTLQPYGRTGKLFEQIWGRQARENIQKTKHFLKNKIDPNKQKEMREELKERRLFLRRQALLGKTNAYLGNKSKDIEKGIIQREKRTFR